MQNNYYFYTYYTGKNNQISGDSLWVHEKVLQSLHINLSHIIDNRVEQGKFSVHWLRLKSVPKTNTNIIMYKKIFQNICENLLKNYFKL